MRGSSGGPVGHTALRSALSRHHGSFALLGPAGVGKRAVVAEWVAGRPAEVLLPRDLGRAAQRPGLLHLVDASAVTDWTPWLRPLEDDAFQVVVVSDTALPTPVMSRLPIFRAGYLSDAEVTQVLATCYPKATPRPVIARLAQGSLDDIDLLTETAGLLPALDKALAEGTLPEVRRASPVALLHALRAICRAVLGLPSVHVSEAARSAVPRAVAAEILTRPVPATKHEARNTLLLTLAALHG